MTTPPGRARSTTCTTTGDRHGGSEEAHAGKGPVDHGRRPLPRAAVRQVEGQDRMGTARNRLRDREEEAAPAQGGRPASLPRHAPRGRGWLADLPRIEAAEREGPEAGEGPDRAVPAQALRRRHSARLAH